MFHLLENPRLLHLRVLTARLNRGLRARRTGGNRQASQRGMFYERAWREAAAQLGADVHVLGGGILQVTLGDQQVRVCRNTTPLDDPVTLEIAGNKPLVHRLLGERGLPVPRHKTFTLESLAQARRFLADLGGACVVKPACDTGAGNGVTSGICRPRDLVAAAVAAASFGRSMLIEEEVAGVNYRLLYLDGKLLDAVERRPPSVAGDGRSTIRQLIQSANAQRLQLGTHAAQVLISLDADYRRTLAAQNLSGASVPAAGERVPVKTVVSDNAAWDNLSAIDRIAPAVVDAGAQAAAAIGGVLVGVDVITPDAGRLLGDVNGVILEVNTTPGFYYHYHQQGGRCPVALHVLRRLFGLAASGELPAKCTDALEAATP